MKKLEALRHGTLSWRRPRSTPIALVPFVCLVVLVAWPLLNTMVSATEMPTKKSVLFLFPQATGLPTHEILYNTIVETMRTHLSEPLDIYAEYLDRVRFPDESYQDRLFDLFCDKYRDKHIDLWIGIGQGTVDLVDKYGKGILLDTPAMILDYAAPHTRAAPWQSRPRTTGVVAELDIRKNLELALSLHPDTKKVYVVSGTAPPDLALEKMARTVLQEHENRVEVVYLSGLTVKDLVDRLGNLPPQSVVLYLGVLRDGTGETFYSKDIVRVISKRTNTPIYSLFSPQVGEGVVGGHVINIERGGVTAGELAARILSGDRPESIPIVRDGVVSDIFDWRQLKRHGIAESKLPKGSLVLYKEWSFFEKHWWIVIGVILFIVWQTILLVFLVNANRKQDKTQKQLVESEGRYRQLLHADRISRIGQLTASLAHELNQPLAAILTSAQAGLRFLSAEEKDIGLLRRIMENIVKDDKRAAAVVTNLRSMVKLEKRLVAPVDLNALLEEVVSILQSEAMLRKVAIERDLDESLPTVTANPETLRQVILNLLMNAFDAMSSSPADQRKVILQTRAVDGSVHVALQDFGPGIQAENPEQLFQPFYTTKGSGMGMGLTICNTIVKDHGGRIWAENAPGGGARFTFTLPVPQDDHEGNTHLHY